MKARAVAALFVLASSSQIWGQIEPYGLEKVYVTDLRMFGNTLYACSQGDGVFRRQLADTGWEKLGLQGKKIRSVYPHAVGAFGLAVTAGIEPERESGDSTLVRCWISGQWNPTDTGMDYATIWEIRSIDGIPSPQICGETFAVGSGRAFVRKNVVWEMILEGMVMNVVRVAPDNTVWIGGESLIFWPFLAKSSDLGQSWVQMFPNLAGDNACNSIAFDRTDSNIVYAGMEGVVIKTTDGGATWERTGLTGTPFYFRGLAIDPSSPEHILAGGVASPDSFGLFESVDGGKSWQNVQPPPGTKGLSSIVMNPLNGNEAYISTQGNGVLKYRSSVVSVAKEPDERAGTRLYQCYPNPFNPKTYFRFRITPARRGAQQADAGGDYGFVSLKVFDIMGKEVATLVENTLAPGDHTVAWDATGMPSGIYFYRIKAGTFVETRKLVIIR